MLRSAVKHAGRFSKAFETTAGPIQGSWSGHAGSEPKELLPETFNPKALNTTFSNSLQYWPLRASPGH